MKTKVEIFSTEELKNFFKNLNEFFDLSIRGFEELETSHEKKNLSIVFLDNPKSVSEKIIKKLHENENFIFVSKDMKINHELVKMYPFFWNFNTFKKKIDNHCFA